jgi:hypothetical protein
MLIIDDDPLWVVITLTMILHFRIDELRCMYIISHVFYRFDMLVLVLLEMILFL